MTAWVAAIAASMGPICVLRAFGAAREIFRLSVLLGPLVLGLGVLGAVEGGAEGAALGFAIAHWALLPVAWVLMLRVTATSEQARLPAAGLGGLPQ
jgi:hypothetical protein